MRRLPILIVAAALAAAPAAFAASTQPSPAAGSPNCADLNSSWSALQVKGNAYGDYSDGTLSVTLAKPGPEESFDWKASSGVAAVIVGDGSQANVYRYDPESVADTQLAAPGGARIGHLEFCYVGQGVLGQRYASGTAQLSAPHGCSSSRFSARVTGRSIARVVFTVDGTRVATRYAPDSAGGYAIRVNPARYRRAEVHRLVARVEFKPYTRMHSKELRTTFKRCQG